MSKRAHGRHPRRPRDFYPTPLKAVLPLLPYLGGVRRFAEPCAGEGDLVRHLESLGLKCVHSGDIATGQDSLAVEDFGGAPVISNTPWERQVLHAMISHFMHHAPFVWLLLELDWAATKQARPFMRHCTRVVIVGRVKWIEGSKSTGFDNCAWYRFEASHQSGPVLHTDPPSLQARLRSATTCAGCGASFQAKRKDMVFCSGPCRQAAYRKRLAVTQGVTKTGDEVRRLAVE
jgi:hypothetical protein